ncbi:hypothetical protein HW555_013550, partial [Spodoptera exigua]
WQCHAPAVAGQVQHVGVQYQGASSVTINRLIVTYTQTPAQVIRTPLSTNAMNVTIVSNSGQLINATNNINAEYNTGRMEELRMEVTNYPKPRIPELLNSLLHQTVM